MNHENYPSYSHTYSNSQLISWIFYSLSTLWIRTRTYDGHKRLMKVEERSILFALSMCCLDFLSFLQLFLFLGETFVDVRGEKKNQNIITE